MVSVVNREAPRPVTPLGIVVDQLQAILQMVEANPNVLKEIATQLHATCQLAAGLDPYVGKYTTQESKHSGDRQSNCVK